MQTIPTQAETLIILITQVTTQAMPIIPQTEAQTVIPITQEIILPDQPVMPMV